MNKRKPASEKAPTQVDAAAVHSPGPWKASREDIDSFDVRGHFVQVYADDPNGELHLGQRVPMVVAQLREGPIRANARLIADAPAMAICLELIALGLARIEPATNEFCFGGLRYGTLGCAAHGWTLILNLIGWDKARASIAKATGKAGGQ